jgi:glycerophosphoryl diester phosphodiesterase
MNRFSLCLFAAFAGMLPIAAVGQDRPRPCVVGHRGLMHEAPEDTLSAFRACLALRCGFEFDVRRTKDGELVCLHDATLDRTTNGKGPLAELLLANVKQLDAGSWFDKSFADERVPTIDEVFALIAAEARGEPVIAVDLKETGGGLEERVVRLAEKHKVVDRLVFIGLAIESADIRSRLKAANRAARAARLTPNAAAISDALADKTADWVYVRFLPSADDVSRIHQAGKRVFIAGPVVAGQETANWRSAAAAGIDALLTDYPIELQKQIFSRR